jgi:GNAT superfamily N-acetyltransferase
VTGVRIRRLTGPTEAEVVALADLTRAVVHAGASIGFMHPLDLDRAAAFWRRVADDVATGARALLVAESTDHDAASTEAAPGPLVGTVHLVLGLPENQPHRADLAKMMVHPDARRQGIAAQLLRAVEDLAIAAGRSLLVLDTVTGGDAERLYARCGWQPSGTIPEYALMPHGGLTSTTFFYRRLGERPITDRSPTTD